MNRSVKKNPFLEIENRKPLGPGSDEMALPLIQAVNIQPGMRVLEGPEPAKLPLSWQNTGMLL
ncbi:hypothetical protein [Caldibacillus debilis]|uniref:Uncharacterized protein n=1 Tax=Caldibacillus debilis TaxID=301148 RepID=A0A150M750_9BACI|nr:hypothetical protein [Caldibacillus debilis]KYD20186.1 hypothetical protein B4135_1962 [Caldibacillus debilis]